jgi:glycerol-3-phosphate cytidylyltransferase-like family protein
VFGEGERMEIVAALRAVDAVFREGSLEQKRDYILEHHADVLVMGDDWAGKFDEFNDTPSVRSSTSRAHPRSPRPRSSSRSPPRPSPQA